MKRIVDGQTAKRIDEYTINGIGIPSLVLMERASLAVADVVGETVDKKDAILVLCGNGNNGADGVCAARILWQRGYSVKVLLVNREGKYSRELECQIHIAENIGVPFEGRTCTKKVAGEYNLIVDAMFGIGLSRELGEDYRKVIEAVNESDAQVISVDIPSGVNSSDGRVMPEAVRADKTVTFGYEKIGMMLYPGAEYAGEVICRDIGFDCGSITEGVYAYEKRDIQLIPSRKAASNKGTYGKVLVVAGSKLMCGAAYLAAAAALKMGAGLVKIYTHEENKTALNTRLAEALLSTYDKFNEKSIKDELKWATCVIIGPGLSTDDTARQITEYVLSQVKVPVIIDADALNLIAQYSFKIPENAIVTPHIGEMARLCATDISSIKEDRIHSASEYAKKHKCICVLKDARTVTAAYTGEVYLNLSGNSGMSTAGSGDVLTGIIAGMCVMGLDMVTAASMGVYIHGLSGDAAAAKYSQYSMTACDIVESINEVMKEVRQ